MVFDWDAMEVAVNDVLSPTNSPAKKKKTGNTAGASGGLPAMLGGAVAGGPAAAAATAAAEGAASDPPHADVMAAAAAAGAALAAAAPGAALSDEQAVRLAKTWYDDFGPFVGTFVMVTPVSGVFFNLATPSACECSIRYNVSPDTGDSYFVRFMYSYSRDDADWRATEMNMARASELPDSDQEHLARAWGALVTRCAKALGRSPQNLPVYTSPSSLSKQLAALGSDNVAEILRLAELPAASEGGSGLSEAEGQWTLGAIQDALAQPGVQKGDGSNNGARAGLAAVKWIAGSGVKYLNPGGPRKKVKSEPGSGRDNGDGHSGSGRPAVRVKAERPAAAAAKVAMMASGRPPLPAAPACKACQGSHRAHTCEDGDYRQQHPQQQEQRQHSQRGQQRIEQQHEEEELQRQKKLVTQRELRDREQQQRKRRRLGAQAALTNGKWRVVLESSWWTSQTYAV